MLGACNPVSEATSSLNEFLFIIIIIIIYTNNQLNYTYLILCEDNIIMKIILFIDFTYIIIMYGYYTKN